MGNSSPILSNYFPGSGSNYPFATVLKVIPSRVWGRNSGSNYKDARARIVRTMYYLYSKGNNSFPTHHHTHHVGYRPLFVVMCVCCGTGKELITVSSWRRKPR